MSEITKYLATSKASIKAILTQNGNTFTISFPANKYDNKIMNIIVTYVNDDEISVISDVSSGGRDIVQIVGHQIRDWVKDIVKINKEA